MLEGMWLAYVNLPSLRLRNYSADLVAINLNQQNHTALVLDTSYCLAKPFQPTYIMGAFIPLLLTVTVCVVLKTFLLATVILKLRKPVLVTLSNVISSFI